MFQIFLAKDEHYHQQEHFYPETLFPLLERYHHGQRFILKFRILPMLHLTWILIYYIILKDEKQKQRYPWRESESYLGEDNNLNWKEMWLSSDCHLNKPKCIERRETKYWYPVRWLHLGTEMIEVDKLWWNEKFEKSLIV